MKNVKEVNVIVTNKEFFDLIAHALAHGVFKGDCRIVFDGEVLGIDYGDASPADDQDFTVGGVFKHSYLKTLKVPEGNKPSKQDPTMTDFSMWLAKRVWNEGNKIADRFYWKGVHLAENQDSENYIDGLETLLAHTQVQRH